MSDVLITYESLFDILRKERSRHDLQELDVTFFSKVIKFLTDLGSNEKIKSENSKKILKELYDLRERKLVDLAMNVVKTGSTIVDRSAMLPEEIQFFDETVSLLSKFRRGVLEEVKDLKHPTIMGVSRKFVAPEVNIEVTEEKKVVAEPQVVTTEDAVSDPYDVKEKVRILTKLPKFMGKKKEILGPFEANEEVELPKPIVDILLRKDKAVKI